MAGKSTSKLSERARAILSRTAAIRAAIDARSAAQDPDPFDLPRMVARPYQIESARVIPELLRQHRRVIAVGPTGCGKNLIASMVIEAEPQWRVLFVVHRYELADQAWWTLRYAGIEAGVLMAQDESLHGRRRVDPNARVQIASVQTAIRRDAMERVDVIVFDEAHRVMAESYQSIARAHPSAMVLGLTATPERTDGKPLGGFFRDMYIIAQPSELQASGYLASPRWFGARADVVGKLTERLKGARTSGGDYSPVDLARAVDSGFLLGNVVSEAIRIAPRVSKVVFAGSVNHSRQLAKAFVAQGVSASHLDGDTPAKERQAMIELLADGDLEVICNYDVLGEGWDLPNLGAVVLARPFRSRTKYLQVVGRGMRWREGPRPIVIDHGNNAPRFGIWPGDDVAWSLEGERIAQTGPLWKQCESCLERIPLGATSCEHCGHECPIERARREREEVECKLEEATRAQYLALRSRVRKMAKAKGAPAGWAEKAIREIVGR